MDIVRIDPDNIFVLIFQCEDIRTFNSANENPRPALTRRLYLIVGQRTTGLSLSTGRGATAAALVRREFRRRNLRPGYETALASCYEPGVGWAGIRFRGGMAYLVEVGADTTLPILAEIWTPSVCRPGEKPG